MPSLRVWVVARWEPDARGRLERAALDLFTEQGFDRTTVTEIAERAGLTKRTFFNHFADKPEVLFWGHEILRSVYTTSIADAPETAAPLEVLAAALQAAAALHEPRPDLIRARHAVISGHPALQEREHLKRATVAGTITSAMQRRGIDEATARLLGETGPAIFKIAYDQWVGDASLNGRLGELVVEALELLRREVAAAPAS